MTPSIDGLEGVFIVAQTPFDDSGARESGCLQPRSCAYWTGFRTSKALKEEDIPSIVKISRLRALAPHLSVLTGNNAVYLPLELSRGIQGPMSGFSHPEAISGIYRAFRPGRTDQAEDIFEDYLPLLNYENQGQWGVAVRKEVLRRRGAIRRARMRSPAPRLCEQELFEIEHLVGRVYHRLKSLGIDNVIGPRA